MGQRGGLISRCGLHRYRTSLSFAAAVSQVANEFLTCVELCARRVVSIEIAYETNAERDVVQIIAVHMAGVNLAPPSIADFDRPLPVDMPFPITK